MLVTIDLLKAQLGGIQSKLDWKTVEPFCTTAERAFRREVGADLYEALSSATENEADEWELASLARACISWSAYDAALPHLKLRVGDLGMMKTTPPGTVAVTKWEYLDTREAVLQQIDDAYEAFFLRLDELRPDAWVGSEAYKARQRHFIRSFDELNQYVPLSGGRRLFQKLVPFLAKAEARHLIGLLTRPVFVDLKTKWQDGDDLNDDETDLLERVQAALAPLALFEALPLLPLRIDAHGFSNSRDKDGAREELIADSGDRNALRQALYNDAQYALSELRLWLDATASPTRWTTYYDLNLKPDSPHEDDDFTYKSHVLL